MDAGVRGADERRRPVRRRSAEVAPTATTTIALVPTATASATVMNTAGARPDHAVASQRTARGRQTKPGERQRGAHDHEHERGHAGAVEALRSRPPCVGDDRPRASSTAPTTTLERDEQPPMLIRFDELPRRCSSGWIVIVGSLADEHAAGGEAQRTLPRTISSANRRSTVGSPRRCSGRRSTPSALRLPAHRTPAVRPASTATRQIAAARWTRARNRVTPIRPEAGLRDAGGALAGVPASASVHMRMPRPPCPAGRRTAACEIDAITHSTMTAATGTSANSARRRPPDSSRRSPRSTASRGSHQDDSCRALSCADIDRERRERSS